MDENQLAELIKLVQESKMPQWWIDYAGQIAYNLQVHTKGLMFDKVTGLYPNEHPESQQHCINSYESITKGSIWKAINNITRIFNNSSYNINISDRTRVEILKYQETEGSLFSQFLEDWIKYAIATDPNGLCVVYPPDYTDDLYRYVCYKDIKLISDDYLIFISEAESEYTTEMVDVNYHKEIFFDYKWADGAPNVKYAGVKTYNRRLEKKYINEVYHVFTKTHFIRFFKEDAGDSQFQYETYEFPKELETLPYFENGGVEVEKDIYESFVQPFIPFGNLALMSHRNHRAVDLMFSYPRMSEVQQPCDTCHGEGRVKCETGWETCTICKGSKYVAIQSPYKVYRKVHDSFDADGRVFSTPSVEFYSPNSAILDYSKKQWITYLEQAEEAVFVQQRQDTGNVESAKSKSIDREELYSWLAKISKVLYGNLQMFLQYLENYINPTGAIKVSVEQPYSFAILTESEAFEALQSMLSSNAPVLLKASQVDNFVNKFVSESSPVKRALQILKKYDLLLYYSNDDVNNMKGQGFVDTAMCQKHALAYPVLIQMYELNNKLFDLEDEPILKKLETEISKYILAGSLRERLLPTNGNGQANTEEEEIEEENA